MANFEEAVLVGGPKDGERLVVNRDYGDYVTVVMPAKRVHMHASAEDRYYYYRIKEVRGSRQVYKIDASEVST